MLTKHPLNKNWFFKQTSPSPSPSSPFSTFPSSTTTIPTSTSNTYLPTSQFPTVAHLDLLHHNLIPDPYIDQNELETLWVNEADWTYLNRDIEPLLSLSRDLDPDPTAPVPKTVLVFRGLDTFCTVYLNNKKILETKDMHMEYRVDVSDEAIREQGGPSELRLEFRNAIQVSREERERIGYKGNGGEVHFGGSERLFLRKAQFHWGWDWGPSINTCGPWKPIYIETYVSRVSSMLVTQEVSQDLKTAIVLIRGTVENPAQAARLEIEILDPEGQSVQTINPAVAVTEATGAFECTFEISNPRLWYPFLYGSQPLYTVKASLENQHVRTQALGLRRLKLLQHPLKDAKGLSFTFQINNISIFCGGSCWIPGDFILPRMTPQRYSDWVALAKSGNQTMIRVWGGGIVEDDAFYDACDREGVLVWQDFLFACGNYPASDDFCELVKAEAEQQVRRVGWHPSLVIWAGNNEDYMLANRWGWEWDPSDEKGPWDHTNFPARNIYERILPDVCERLAGDVPYWRSSPYGGAFANDPTVGDTHIWDVWHGKMSPYQDYKEYMGRFITEFGFESAPDLRTINKGITDPRERHSQSRTFDAHDKGPGNARRYGMYMSENFRYRMQPLPTYIYCSQFLQAQAMQYAYNLWRRCFRGPGNEICSGALVWQLNDIWPSTSWALVDVDLHRKAAFYVTKRALAPVVVGMERVVTKKPSYIVSSYLPEKGAVEVWVVNGTVETIETVLKFKAFDIEMGDDVALAKGDIEVRLLPNRSTDIAKVDIPRPDTTVIVAYLDEKSTSKRLARWVSWPEPLKYLRFNQKLNVTARVQDDRVILSTNAPVVGVVASVPIEEGEDAIWDDNLIDLVPGEEVEIAVKGLNGRKVMTRFLCDWELEDSK